MYELNVEQVDCVNGGNGLGAVGRFLLQTAAGEAIVQGVTAVVKATSNMDLAAFGERMDNMNGGNMK